MKSQKALFILLGITVGFVTAVLGIYLKLRPSYTKVSSSNSIQQTKQPTEELATWTDQSEFTFQYPKSLSINPHEEDKENYAHVELTSASYSGSLIIWVKDTTAETLDEWVMKTHADGVLDSTLGGEPAKKQLVKGTPDKLLNTVIRNGYLYQVEADLSDADFWNAVYSTVSSSFTFTQSSKNNEGSSLKDEKSEQTQDAGDTSDISTDEEVIE